MPDVVVLTSVMPAAIVLVFGLLVQHYAGVLCVLLYANVNKRVNDRQKQKVTQLL